MVSNFHVYGLEDSLSASKYPMSVDISDCTPEMSKTVLRLARADKGSGEDTFLNGIVVQLDLTASLKMWTQLQRYHFVDFVSSQSTMHRLTKMDVNKQCNEYVDSRMIDILQELITDYKLHPSEEAFLRCIYNIPSGYRLTARLTTNYRQLKTIYSQRRLHRLPEWREFCGWIEELPFSGLITGKPITLEEQK